MSTVLLLTACQKEGSLEIPSGSNPGGGGNPQPAGLLTRSVYVSGTDSSVIEYGYDAAKRLVSHKVTSIDSDEDMSIRIVRNNAGVMTQYITKGAELQSNGVDSLVTMIGFNSAQNQYTYSLTAISDAGVTYTDSSAFTYDGSGNLTVKTSYLKAGPSPYIPYQKSEYTYASGNATSEKYYMAGPTGNWTLEGTYNYTHDNKLNPLKLGTEALIVLDDAGYFGNNNVSALNFVAAADPSDNFTFTITYTYNTADKPSGGTAVQMPGSESFDLKYYYN